MASAIIKGAEEREKESKTGMKEKSQNEIVLNWSQV
jgi:hypothetical protein